MANWSVKLRKSAGAVLKILRDDRGTHREIEVSALPDRGFETFYTAGDNSKVVPTDTIRTR